MIPATPRWFTLAAHGHEIHVTEWGDCRSPTLVMWHGLARTGRDFDTAAAHLSARFHVLCPDTIGRGWSNWSAEPEHDYTLPAYVTHAQALLDHLGIAECAWVGTSMGGLVGLCAAAGPLKGRIRRLVLNDIGPVGETAALSRIRGYLTHVPDFATIAEYFTFIRAIYAPYGTLTEAEWRTLALSSARRRDDGRITVHYDPRAMEVFAAQAGNGYDLWPVYDMLDCPTLVLRGEHSDLLSAATAQAMTGRGPCARLVTVPGCGHAPALNTTDQLAVLEEFLRCAPSSSCAAPIPPGRC